MHDLYSRTGPGYSLFINTPRLPVKTETPWSGGEYSSSSGEFPHPLDRSYSHPYSNLAASGQDLFMFKLWENNKKDPWYQRKLLDVTGQFNNFTEYFSVKIHEIYIVMESLGRYSDLKYIWNCTVNITKLVLLFCRVQWVHSHWGRALSHVCTVPFNAVWNFVLP